MSSFVENPKTTLEERRAARAEELACDFLVRQGMKILDRSWKCSYGQADIVALDGKTLVFCIVKVGTNIDFNQPECAFAERTERLKKLAGVYRARCAIEHNSYRFDAISILVGTQLRRAHLHYFADVYRTI
ncbi:MAG: YraN family protein [Coriobacteriia bacterium]|nr:YraN family protein [Coriobacteriia bacterium]